MLAAGATGKRSSIVSKHDRFPAMWRKTLTAERRGELLAHLKGWRKKCDYAFRVFALTAPVLPGRDRTVSGSRIAPRAARILAGRPPRRFASASREISGAAIDPMAAAAAIFVFATSAAYLSARVPNESIGEALSVP